jgi:hypothetical protein
MKKPTLKDLGLSEDDEPIVKAVREKSCPTCGVKIPEQQRECADCASIRKTSSTSATSASAREKSWESECPYCGAKVSSEVEKCKHCGEFIAPSHHSDLLAGFLGLFLGPVGLWYKGNWAAGFAWLTMGILLSIPTGGLAAPFFWIGMMIHAVAAKPKR